MTTATSPILVVACGNPMAGDDGFAQLVAQKLTRDSIEGVEVIDLGMSPTNLIDHLDGRRMLVVVDAAVCPDLPAGAMIEFDWDDPNRPQLCSEKFLSSHGLGIGQQIELARRLGVLPQVVKFIGVSIESSHAGESIDPRVVRCATSAACRLRELVSQPQPEIAHA